MLQQPTFPVSYNEADVRRVCGPAVFERADILQRAGHVLGPRVDGAGLSASVRGTWRLVEQASVSSRVGQLVPVCSCGAEFCQHAGALLLHWLRTPAAFTFETVMTTEPQPGALNLEVAAAGEPPARQEPAGESVVPSLERDTANHLRQIARERGIRLKDKVTKAGLVEQLNAALLDPANIDLALAVLPDDERRLLEAATVLSRLLPVTDQLLAEAYPLFGGSGSPPTRRLLDRGLLFFDPEVPSYQGTAYMVPLTVAAELAPAADFLQPRPGAPSAAARAIDLVPLVMAIVQELPGLELDSPPGEPLSDLTPYVPPGFRLHPDDAGLQLRELQQPKSTARLVLAPRLRPTDLARLSGKFGQPVEAVEFAVDLLFSRGMLEVASGLSLREDRLHDFYRLPPILQLAALVAGWLATQGGMEFRLLLRPNSPVALRWNPYQTYAGQFLLDDWIFSVNMLLTGVLGLLEPGAWYDVESLVEKLWPLVRLTFPLLGLLSQPRFGQSGLVLAQNQPNGATFNLNSAGSAVQFFPILIESLLTGPLSWFGFVDLPEGQSPPRAFRVRPAAGILVDRIPTEEGSAQAVELLVADDLTILVPSGHPDAEVHALLAQAGEVVEASAGGLRYRLTAERAQALFDLGVTGPELLGTLAAHGAAFTPAAREQLERWWGAYGQVRLYDDLTVIELADDLLLPELRSVTALDARLVYAFSPRLIAVESGAVDDLVAELTRLGYAPRVMEGA